MDSASLLIPLFEPCVNELLHALTLVGLGHEEIAFRVHSQVVCAVELAGPVTMPAECTHDLECLPVEHVNELIGAVVDEHERLPWIGGEADVPYRSAPE